METINVCPLPGFLVFHSVCFEEDHALELFWKSDFLIPDF